MAVRGPSLSSTDQLLDKKPPLSEVCEYARTSRWYQLGVQLQVDEVELKEIKDEPGSDKRTRMFQLWLRTQINATRRQLLTALRSKHVGEEEVALKYENMLQTKEMTSSAFTEQSLENTSNPSYSEDKSSLRYNRVNVIKGGNVYNNPNINVNVNVNRSAAESEQTDTGDYQGKQYSRKKVKDQSPEPCIDARRPLSEKSGQYWKFFKDLLTLFCLVLVIILMLLVFRIIDLVYVVILLPTFGIAIVIYLMCGGDTDFIKHLLAFLPFAILMKKFGGLGYSEDRSSLRYNRVNVIKGGNVYNNPNINVNVNVNRSASEVDQTDTDDYQGKVYSRKKTKDQSTEPLIDARRLISEKSGDGIIKKFINFIVQPKVVCALFVLIIVVMVLLLLHYYYSNKQEVTTPCHQIKSHNEVFLVLKDKISSPKIFATCLHLSRVEADIAHKENILINEVLNDILKLWYEQHVEDPCWEHIVKALKCIGENHLAKDIHDHYCKTLFF